MTKTAQEVISYPSASKTGETGHWERRTGRVGVNSGTQTNAPLDYCVAIKRGEGTAQREKKRSGTRKRPGRPCGKGGRSCFPETNPERRKREFYK